MATLHVAPKPGFPEFGATTSDILISAKLTSSSDLAGGVIANSGTESYSADGITLAANNVVNWEASVSAANKTLLERAGTMTVWVEAGAVVDTTTAGTQFGLLGAYGTTWFFVEHANGSTTCRARDSSGSFGTSVRVKPEGKGEHIRIDMTWTSGKITVYFDYLPLIQFDGEGPGSGQFDNFLGLGTSHVGAVAAGYAFKNFQLSTTPITVPVNYKLNHIAAFGHSFTDNGDYASANSDIVGDKGNGADGDAKTLPQIHRVLGEHNIGIPEGKIRNYGVGGVGVASGANDLSVQIASAITSGHPLKVALLQFGTNEIINSSSDFSVDYGPSGTTYDFETSYQTEITSLINNGADIILIGNVTSVSNHATYDSAAYVARVAACNVMIDSLVAANSQCYLVDLFNALGGESLTTSEWASGDYHPNDLGYNKIGAEFANKLIELL